jgi:hypothetical protein
VIGGPSDGASFFGFVHAGQAGVRVAPALEQAARALVRVARELEQAARTFVRIARSGERVAPSDVHVAFSCVQVRRTGVHVAPPPEHVAPRAEHAAPADALERISRALERGRDARVAFSGAHECRRDAHERLSAPPESHRSECGTRAPQSAAHAHDGRQEQARNPIVRLLRAGCARF